MGHRPSRGGTVDQRFAEIPDFHAEVAEAAFQAGQDVEAAASRAVRAVAWADQADDPGLLQRARLVLADVAGRRGQTAELGMMARTALAWGLDHDDEFVAARAHRLLATFYEVLGDGGSALEHAIAGVELLPSDASDFFRGDQETRVGTAYMAVQLFAPARERFNRLITWADEIGDGHLKLRTFNNLAFLEFSAGDGVEAARLSEEMTAESRRSGIALTAAAWDTVARVQMSAGDYRLAEQTFKGALTDTRIITEADDIAALHVGMATCQRMLGRFQDAARSLDVADVQCAERDLGSTRAEAVEERSALAAATDDYQLAYELYRKFHDLKLEQRSVAKAARAGILAAVFETDEAVRTGERYREMSERDHLTGLHNRRYAEEVVPGLLQTAARQGSGLGVAIVDLDHFKRVNDTYSHQVGDAVLQRFSTVLQDSCPSEGLAARLGGEEFLLVLPESDAAGRVCEDLRQAVGAVDWHDLVGDLPVTVSIGLATCTASGSSFPEMLAEADRRLYQAKRSGRDQVVGHPVTDAPGEPSVPHPRGEQVVSPQ
jgi:diguanylate cyclase (GGDEF)-like protein